MLDCVHHEKVKDSCSLCLDKAPLSASAGVVTERGGGGVGGYPVAAFGLEVVVLFGPSMTRARQRYVVIPSSGIDSLGEDSTYILTLWSSPPEANMHGSVGFHATTLTQPGLWWPSSVSMRVPFSLCQM